MDLIILQPGDTSMVPTGNTWADGGSLIDGVVDGSLKWDKDAPLDWVADPLKTIELVSVHQGM